MISYAEKLVPEMDVMCLLFYFSHLHRNIDRPLCHISCSIGSFKLEINPGEFTDSEIIVMLGENGTGKTTFIRMLAGRLEPDDGS